MKPASAFAFGLWTGALAASAVGFIWFWRIQPGQRAPSAAVSETTANEIQRLNQEQSRQSAEADRLRQTIAELKRSLAERGAGSSRTAPFREPVSPATDWIERAVAGADPSALPRLEALALQNNEPALEALGRMSGLDGGVTLTRVWQSGKLNLINLRRATRLLGATLEVNSQAELLLHALFADANADLRLLRAAVDGVADVAFLSSQVPVDFASRLSLLDVFQSSVADEPMRAAIARAAAGLRARADQAGAEGQ
jgi:hypothetical protein